MLHTPEVIKTCINKDNEESRQQVLIDIVELGQDYNLNVREEDKEMYLKITGADKADTTKKCI